MTTIGSEGSVSSAIGELVVGVGCRPGVAATLIVAGVREIVGAKEIRCLATIDRRAGEDGMVAAARELGVPVLGFAAAELAEVEVPSPGERVRAAVGTASVAEAAAISAAVRIFGAGRLVVPKTTVAGTTIAVAAGGQTQAPPRSTA
ncbi:cobalamin biosynthesis protein [Nocardia terpenica]|nr:cobalamin biosynthesis protein [Nocardia terpenica]MBF6108970.1 cobalamin biosynthesis protein [Nocardia terpenica]MBF6114718.1 cobalamin biosynthesis protein [Nocardia terpenica]MBF6121813.1 cobalamin biosynthesis protein [Nocardia terpenica]